MPKEVVFVATCLIAAFGTGIMALYANYPLALAPGMGLNAYFAYAVVLGMGYTWQVALGRRVHLRLLVPVDHGVSVACADRAWHPECLAHRHRRRHRHVPRDRRALEGDLCDLG